jgi:hypothetical protein
MAAKGGFIGGFFFAIGDEVAKMAKELANAVLRCLAKQPAQRFKTYDELRAELQAKRRVASREART